MRLMSKRYYLSALSLRIRSWMDGSVRLSFFLIIAGPCANILHAQSLNEPEETTMRFGSIHLKNIAAIAASRDGRLHLLDTVRFAILTLSPTGEVGALKLRGIQKRGITRWFAAVGIVSDSMWLWEPEARKLIQICLRTGGTRVKTFKVPRPRFVGAYWVPRSLQPGSAAIVEELATSHSFRVLARSGRLVIRLHGGSEVFDTLATLWASHGLLELERSDGLALVSEQPWAPRDFVRFSPESDFFGLVQQSESPDGGPVKLRVSVGRAALAEFEFSREIAYQPRRLEDDTVSAFVNRLSQTPFGMAFQERAQLQRSIGEALYQPHWFPPVTDALLSVDGRLWMSGHITSSPNAWLVVDASSGQTCEYAFPSSSHLLAIAHSVVWLVRQPTRHDSSIEAYQLPPRTDCSP